MAASATDTGDRAGPSGRSDHSLTTLESGVRVITERVPGVRSVALGFLVDTGSVVERDEQAGISHLLEHMLFRGTERYGSEEIDQLFDEMGAEINAGTDKESTTLYTRVLDGHLERAFDVMADMVWRPQFGELDAEKDVVLEEIAMYEDDPQDRAFDLMGRAIFADHPLGRPVIGTAAAVAGVDRDGLAAYHAERYRPGSIVIAAAGSVDHEALVELTRAAEAKSANGAGAAARPELATPAFAPRVQFLEKDTEQYHLCLGGAGIARDDERRFALRVLEGVLGGTSSSRLFQEVRERRGLAYSVFCWSNLYAGTGEVGIYLGTRPDKLDAALDVVAGELRRCVEDPASEEELVRSRENLKGRMVLALESTSARMGRLGGSLLAGMPILSTDEVIARIDAVGIDEVRELAGELFAPDQLSLACVGADAGAFERASSALGARS